MKKFLEDRDKNVANKNDGITSNLLAMSAEKSGNQKISGQLLLDNNQDSDSNSSPLSTDPE